ncbi:hypothetical protein Tcan_07132 [Toxocara canis]|uniref:RRM domain-containing protein n=1 Tax=Toxocara canis TaxID=6265 RepID=A0A0B2VJT1_TOXCA|nr:hypothetical protein Tcan_07132 [Toxocara canis]
MGPLEKVVLRPEDEAKEARRVHRYALIIFNDEESVPFAVECMDGIRMFGLELSVRPKKGTKQRLPIHGVLKNVESMYARLIAGSNGHRGICSKISRETTGMLIHRYQRYTLQSQAPMEQQLEMFGHLRGHLKFIPNTLILAVHFLLLVVHQI